jgi:hypothetical protein
MIMYNNLKKIAFNIILTKNKRILIKFTTRLVAVVEIWLYGARLLDRIPHNRAIFELLQLK